MAEQVCNECNSTYDPDTVNIPMPIPDLMCANCGTQLTQEQVEALVGSQVPPSP